MTRGILCSLVVCSLALSSARGQELPWGYDLKKGLEAARQSGKRVFIDFTGEG